MTVKSTMKAVYLDKPGVVSVREVKTPKPKPSQVLIRVKACGVCGSDVHFYRSGRIGDYVVRKPMILGHECAGEVAGVGRAVKGLKEGDRVTVEPGQTCGKCRHCTSGRYNLCPDVEFLATPPYDGAFCEYFVTRPEYAFKLPDAVDFEEGAMMEPLSVGMHAGFRGQVKAGQSVAVLGAGPIGLVTVQAVRAMGASPIFATDIDPFRLRKAKKLGAAAVVNAKKEDPVEAIRALSDGGVDVVIETAGTTATGQQCIEVVRNGGVVVWVGMSQETTFPVNVMAAICKEIDIRGIFRYANCYPPSIQLVAEGKIDVKSLITHRFPLEQAGEALEFNASPAKNRIKTMIEY